MAAKKKANTDPATVDARPTKRLVAYVITKDIRLEDAILDLIDNSIDGARRIRSNGKLDGSNIQVDCDKTSFRMVDNCGGMSVEMARDYAFRFGRPQDYAPLDGSSAQIGNFGVGMKRALLKMGKTISVSSKTKTEFFELRIDVEKWLKDDVNWSFKFTDFGKRATPADETGTLIEVTNLYTGVAERFEQAEFQKSLTDLVRDKQFEALGAGLSVLVNNYAITTVEIGLLQSKDIKPIFKAEEVGTGKDKVSVRLYAGLDKSNNDLAGWSIICNGRTILRSDRSVVTGWGYKEGSDRVVSYHHQYARFRGYIFFDSKKPDALPWNTTKTGLDVEHPLYRKYRLEMITAMKDVFLFLNDVDKEKDATDKPLQKKMEAAKSVQLTRVLPSKLFVRPPKTTPTSPSQTLTWIRYQRPTPTVKRVMDSLDVSSAEDAGGETFDLYANTMKVKRK